MPRRSTTESNVSTTPSPSPASADWITSVASARTCSASSAWSPTGTPYVAASSSAEQSVSSSAENSVSSSAENSASTNAENSASSRRNSARNGAADDTRE